MVFFSPTSDILKLTYGSVEMLSEWQTQFGHISGNDLTIYLHDHSVSGTNVELRDNSIGKAIIFGGSASERIDISNQGRLNEIDIVYSGGGDDTIRLNPSFSIDTFDGGDGVDTISFVRSWEAV